jgi:hypothetical protein
MLRLDPSARKRAAGTVPVGTVWSTNVDCVSVKLGYVLVDNRCAKGLGCPRAGFLVLIDIELAS